MSSAEIINLSFGHNVTETVSHSETIQGEAATALVAHAAGVAALDRDDCKGAGVSWRAWDEAVRRLGRLVPTSLADLRAQAAVLITCIAAEDDPEPGAHLALTLAKGILAL